MDTNSLLGYAPIAAAGLGVPQFLYSLRAKSKS
jgi:hypothetical protein